MNSHISVIPRFTYCAVKFIENTVKNSNCVAQISFRVNNLDKLQAFTLVREIVGSTHEEALNKKTYLGYIPLTENNFDEINDYYVRQRINIEDCDIFVTVTSHAEITSVDIPTIVNRMLKYIDCKLTFSV